MAKNLTRKRDPITKTANTGNVVPPRGRLTTIRDAAAILGLSVMATKRLVVKGELPGRKFGGKWYCIDVDEFLDAVKASRDSRPSRRRNAADIDDLLPTVRRF